MAETASHLSDLRAKRIDKAGFVRRLEVLNRKKIQCPACPAQYVLGEAMTIRTGQGSMLYVYTCPGCGKEDAVGLRPD